MTHLNETIGNQSQVHEDISLLFAGHLLIVFYCLIFIFGLLGKLAESHRTDRDDFHLTGNSAVIFVAVRKKKYCNVTNCYVVNLAIADLLFLTVSIPYTTYLGLVNAHPFGDTVCKIYTYLAYVRSHIVTVDTKHSTLSEPRYFSWPRAIL